MRDQSQATLDAQTHSMKAAAWFRRLSGLDFANTSKIIPDQEICCFVAHAHKQLSKREVQRLAQSLSEATSRQSPNIKY